MISYEEAKVAHERVLRDLRGKIQNMQVAIAKFQREMAKNPNDSILQAQMELLQDSLNRLERDYDDKSSQAIQGWV